MSNKQLKLITQQEPAEFKCWFDGAYDVHTHRAGFGCVILNQGKRIMEVAESMIGKSSNHSEYLAVREILYHLRRIEATKRQIVIFGDSKLVVQQMMFRWRIKAGEYVELAHECLALRREFCNLRFQWIPREQNKICDDLSRQA